MKQRKIVSMIGALVIIIGAVALITGCPQANGNKDKKENTTTNNGGTNISINGVWKSTTPSSQSDLEEGLTDVYLAFDGQMHIYAYRKRGVLYKGNSCAYTISGDVIKLAGRTDTKFSINNNVLTIEAYMGSWVKVNTPTLAEMQNAENAPE